VFCVRVYAVALACLLGWFAVGGARADVRLRDERVEVTADQIEYFRDRGVFVAEGRVEVVYGGRRLQADWAAFGERTRQGVASGHVSYRDGNDVVQAAFIQFDVDSLEGVLFDGELDMGEDGLRLAARELVRTGRDRYRVFDARFTTCRCPAEERVPWAVRASRSDIEIGGYGTARNTTFEVLGVPVLWLPWAFYPVKTERQTGLLVPDVAFGGRNGAGVGLPFFWAVADPVGVTLTPRWTSRRGFKQEARLEAVHGSDGRTDVFAAYARDEDVLKIPSNVPPASGGRPFSANRGMVALRHTQRLPGGVELRADGNWVSDNRYLLDFDDMTEHRRDRFLESSAFAFAHKGRSGRLALQTTGRWADDVQARDFADRDDFLLQRWGEAEAHWLDGPLPGLSFLSGALDVDYAYFGRLHDPVRDLSAAGSVVGDRLFLDVGIDGRPSAVPGAFEGEGDGRFEEGELLADRGHRLELSPRLSLPMRWFGALEVTPEAGYRQTLYWSGSQGFEERGELAARADVSLRLRRRFAAAQGAPWEHELVPRIGWALLAHRGRSQQRNPLFTPAGALPQRRLRMLALDNVLFDPSDRIRDVNQLVAGIDQRLYRRRGVTRRLVGELGLIVDYDFERGGGGLGRIVAEGRRLRLWRSTNRFQVVFDPDRGRIDEGLAETSVQWPGEVSTTLRYRYVRDIPRFFEEFPQVAGSFAPREFDRIDQLQVQLRVPFLERWALGYHLRYSLAGNVLLTNSGSLEYVSKCRCWAVGVEVSSARNQSLGVRLRYTVLGFGDDARNPFAASRKGWFSAGASGL